MTITNTQECGICSLEQSEPADRIFLNNHWAAEIPPGTEVPGWFYLRTRRHADKVTGLNKEELASLGRNLQDLVSAVERATGAPAVYMLAFGENHRHFHILVTARGEDVPLSERGGAIVGRAKKHIDSEAAQIVAQQVR